MEEEGSCATLIKQQGAMHIRFQLGLGAILFFFCVFGGLITYFIQRNLAEEGVRRQAALVMAGLEATRAYMREELRPRMFSLAGQDHFIIEAMSTSYATRVIMEKFRDQAPEFEYRRVAINARNPDFEANAFERDMIRYFLGNPGKTSWFGLRTEGERPCYVQVVPVRFTRTCLRCHGDPEDAPAEILRLYGASRGFGRRPGEIAAVQSIAIAAAPSLAAMRHGAFQVFSLIVAAALFLFAVIWIFFDFVAARKVRSVLGLFEGALSGTEPPRLPAPATGDAFGDLHRLAGLLAARLRQEREQVEEHAIRLEILVDRLRRSQDLLMAVFAAITDPMALVDGQGEIRTVNQAFLDCAGLDGDSLEGRSLHDPSLEALLPFSRCLGAPLPPDRPLSRECRAADGRVFQVSVYPVRLPEDDRGGFVCLARDVTAEQERRRRVQQAERLAAVGRLAAGVAHEINNPLGVILCYADLLDKEIGTPQGREDLQVIQRQAENCRRIVGDLLNFARGGAPERAEVDPGLLMRETCRLFAARIDESGVELSLDIAPRLSPCLLDRNQIRQVLVNLLVNALDACPRGGRIRAVARQEGEERIRMEIRNTGPAIPAEDLARIFDPFFTTKPQGRGTGLGLSISYGIVREHGGDIVVRSAEGGETCFSVLLPLSGSP